MVVGCPCWEELPKRSVGRTENCGRLTEKNEVDCSCKCERMGEVEVSWALPMIEDSDRILGD